jgi:hypothetical protein
MHLPSKARDIYLHFYGAIDTIDAVIKKAGIDFRSWRYYHRPVNHGKGIALASAFSFYEEIISGSLEVDWKITNKQHRMNFYQFQQRLAEQMMDYDPKYPMYAGDERLRAHTCTTLASRTSSRNRNIKRQKLAVRDDFTGNTTSEISLIDVSKAIGDGRLNDSLLEFAKHVESKNTLVGTGRSNLEQKCFVCGKQTTTFCTICKKEVTRTNKNTKVVETLKVPIPLCFFGNKRNKVSTPGLCFLRYHTPHHFGLCMSDSKARNKKEKDWNEPTKQQKENWEEYMQTCLSYCEDVDVSDTSNNSTATATATTTNDESNLHQKHQSNNHINNNNNGNVNEHDASEQRQLAKLEVNIYNNNDDADADDDDDDVVVLDIPGGIRYEV